MMKKLMLLLSLIMPVCLHAAIDNRQYVSDEKWATFPYNTVVQINPVQGTGWFISDRFLITAAHNVRDAAGAQITAITFDGHTVPLDCVPGASDLDSDINDWAICVTADEYRHKTWLQMSDDVAVGDAVTGVGFGGLAIMTDQEIRDAKNNPAIHTTKSGNGP